MMYRIRNWLVATLLLLCTPVGAATLSDIQVSNGNQQARITLSFIGDPDYAFSHQSKRTVALDIKQTGVIQGLPLLFSGNNLASSDCRRSHHCTNLWLDDGAGAGNGRQYADSDIMVSRTCSHRMVNAWRGFVGHRIAGTNT